jgi:protein-disulfide isomerase
MSKKNAGQSRSERASAALAEQRRRERTRRLMLIGGVVVGLLIVVVGAFVVQSQRTTVGAKARSVPSGLTGGYGVVVGRASAPTTLRVYEDFQCPICDQFEKTTGDRLRAAVAAGKVKIDYRMVSFLDRASTNNYSSRALNAAAVVLDTSGKDTFVKFHQLLFDSQPAEGTAGPTDSQLVDLAVQAGASRSAVQSGIENGEFAQWVTNTQGAMSKAGVNGTPTVFVNGKKAGASLQQSIDAALQAAG